MDSDLHPLPSKMMIVASSNQMINFWFWLIIPLLLSIIELFETEVLVIELALQR